MDGPIDKLEVRAPRRDKWSDDLRDCARSVTQRDRLLRYHQGARYSSGVDLRRFGYSSLLYLNNRTGGSDKLVFDGVGSMTLDKVVDELSALFQTDVMNLGIARIDLAVDVPGFTVSWFRSHAFVSKKKSTREIGNYDWKHEVSSGVETLYFGARPNLFRIYDKVAQLKAEQRRLMRNRQFAAAEVHDHHLLSTQGACITRVERQYGGGKIPYGLATLSSVQHKAIDINPFEPLHLTNSWLPEIPAHVPGGKYLRIRGFNHDVELLGLQGVIAELNRRTGGKGKRMADKILAYSATQQLSGAPELYGLYRESLLRQLVAPSSHQV